MNLSKIPVKVIELLKQDSIKSRINQPAFFVLWGK